MFRKYITITIFTILSLASLTSFGQLSRETYFPEAIPGKLLRVFDYQKVDDGVIIAASYGDATTQVPVLYKLNLNGEIAWFRMNPEVPESESCYGFNFEIFREDGFLYASSLQSKLSKNYHTFWKVDPETGEIIWVRSYYANSSVAKFAEYDSATYIAAYLNNSFFTTIAVINKENGDTLKTKSFDNSAWLYGIAVDGNKNIYFSNEDKLTKFSLNNFNHIIWEKQYTERHKTIDDIHILYLDKFDNIFLFNGSESGIVTKINASTGEQDWYTPTGSEGFTSEYIDLGGYLYITYQQAFVGGGTYYFQTAKVDKASGKVVWNSFEKMNPVGKPAGHSGGSESALGMDVDCSGNVYLTGYYGDANYGPEAWGVMKLNADGTKNYDRTITEDSAFYDDYSLGFAAYVFKDTVIYLGQLENVTGDVNPTFVKMDAATGTEIQRKDFGKNYDFYSITLDIVNYRDSVYILKQQQNYLYVEMYNPDSKLRWRKKISIKTGTLYGGQMAFSGNTIYVSAYQASAAENKLFVYSLSAITGDITGVDAKSFSALAKPFELEADANAAYVFFNRQDSLFYMQWNAAGFSEAFFTDKAYGNMKYNGKLDIVSNEGGNLLVLGRSEIFQINKNTLAKTAVFTYAAPANYYDMHTIGNKLYLAGQNQTGQQLLTAIDKSTMKLLWDSAYFQHGQLYEIVADEDDSLYISGAKDSIITVFKVSQANGKRTWTYVEDTLANPKTLPYDLEINKAYNYLIIAGAGLHNSGSTDVFIKLLDLKGKSLVNYTRYDEINAQSQANSIAVLKDSIWVGGALNRKDHPKQGFVYSIYHPYVKNCYNSKSVSYITSCKNYTSPSGKFVWTSSFTYMDTVENASGCDSIMIINLTINKVNTAVTQSNNKLTANISGATYQWLDCNQNNTPISGETSQTFTANADGEYAVAITQGACTDTSACYLVSGVGVDQADFQSSEINIYPNPTTGLVYIKGFTQAYSFVVYDALGRQCILPKQPAVNNVIDLSALMPGVYMIKINHKNQEKFFNIVKIH